VPLYLHYPRLAAKSYVGPRTYFVTICCHNRRPIFRDLSAGHQAVEILSDAAAKHGFSIHAFCVMPDHLHFLVEGVHEHSNLAKFVTLFKQRTAFHIGRASLVQLWQNRFYEHILRSSDAVNHVACYIWMNPVRKGLCASPTEYPLSGSQTGHWMAQNIATADWTPPWKTTQAGLKSGTYRTNT